MKLNFLVILFSLILFSCVVPRNYSRAKEKVDRIVDKFPEILENDTTVVIFDTTITTKGVLIDSSLVVKKNDTIYVEKEKLKIKLIRGKRDSIFLTAECKPDTIVVNQTQFVPVYKKEDKHLIEKTFLGLSLWYWVLIGIILILIFTLWLKKYK